jgi:rubrerythrin
MTMQPETEPLADAFVRQSVAAAKNRIRAQKAAQEKNPAQALFLALAQGQEVQAKKALLLLRGRIGVTAENLAEALQESRELAVETLPWTVLAQAEGDRAAGALLVQMARAQASHLAVHEASLRDAGVYHVCAICGHIHAGADPGRCPVCQALPEKFVEVRA